MKLLLPGRGAILVKELTISPGWDSRLGRGTGAMCGTMDRVQIDVEGKHVRESRNTGVIVWH